METVLHWSVTFVLPTTLTLLEKSMVDAWKPHTALLDPLPSILSSLLPSVSQREEGSVLGVLVTDTGKARMIL